MNKNNSHNTTRNEFKREKITNCPVCNSSSNVFVAHRYDDRYGQPDLYTMVQCPECTAYYLSDPIAEDQLDVLYAKYYPSLDRAPAETSNLRKILKAMRFPFQLLKKIDGTQTLLSNLPKNSSVLDIGCGYYTELPQEIKERSLDWEGLEVNPKVAETIRSTGLRCYLGKINTFKSKKQYDYILMSQVIEHQMNLSTNMRAMRKLLKAGGKIFILTPNTDSLQQIHNPENWIHWHTPYHTVVFNERSIQLLAHEHKFRVIKYTTYTPTHWALLQDNYTFAVRGKKNATFYYTFSVIPYLLRSVLLRLTDNLHPKNNPCMYCVMEKN